MLHISLKDAVSHRPGESRSPLRMPVEDPTSRRIRDVCNLPAPMWTDDDKIIVRSMWTPKEFHTFERLTAMCCSHIHTERLKGKHWLENFKHKHGREKCDMMLAELRRRDEQAWFADEKKRKGS
jgi:hypothetical protein